MDIIRAWKYIGETPLQCLRRVKDDYHITEKCCYTGRLDPMAQGVMIILSGPKINDSHFYNSASKTYRFQAILGIETTSYDPLGRITNYRNITAHEADHFMSCLLSLKGYMEQNVPPYSSYKHNGDPLWLHARNGTLPEVMPTKKIIVHDVKALQDHPTLQTITSYKAQVMDDLNDFKASNASNASNSSADEGFYIEQTIDDWMSLDTINHIYRISFEANVGSGTYIRALVHDVAAKLMIPAHVFRITRTAV